MNDKSSFLDLTCSKQYFFLAALVFNLLLTGINLGQVKKSVKEHRLVPIREMTEDVETLFGDPEKPGEPFVIRIRELAGGIIPPHRHPVDEHITVVQGKIYFGVGNKFDPAAMQELNAGSYAFIPRGSVMFGYTPGPAIVQVHGIGPFHIHWKEGGAWRHGLTTLDSPGAANIFKFNRGEVVTTPRGRGKILQGYDSGEIIGYDIEGDDGNVFMAEECEIETSAVRKPLTNRLCASHLFAAHRR